MRVRHSGFFSLLLASAATAQPAQSPTFSADRIRADMTYLADDLLEGRNAGTRGYDLAAKYVAARYAALGLQPTNGSGYLQNVPFVIATPKAEAKNAVQIGGKAFLNGEDIVLSGSSLYPDQSETAEVVFVGYGFEDKRYGFDDYAGLDVRGKVVAVLGSLPDGAPSDVLADLADKRIYLAEEKGAIGLFSIATPQMLKQMSWDRIKAYSAVPRLRWQHPDGRPEVIAPKIRLGALLGPNATAALLAGTPLPAETLNAAIEDRKFKPKGFAIPGKIQFERHSAVEKLDSANVIGLLPGSDPKFANEVILFTAHLDHDGVVPADKGDTIMNGAMDNAAGVATMLEAARAFAEDGNRPKRSVMFAAVTAEEDGLLGAEYLARYPVLKDKKVVAVVNLDMPILTYDFQDVIAFGAEHSTMGPAVDRAVQSVGIKLSPDPMPEEGLFTRSDHYMFVKEGVRPSFLRPAGAGKAKQPSRTSLPTIITGSATTSAGQSIGKPPRSSLRSIM